MRLVREFAKEYMERRPDLGTRDPVLAEVNRDFEAIFAVCIGRSMVYLYRRIEGRLLECVTVIRNWIVTLKAEVQAVTGRSAFEWVERTAALTDIDLPIEGPDGRHARLRRVVGMLDSVNAMGNVDYYDVIDSKDLDGADPARIVGAAVPAGPYRLICRMFEPGTDAGQPLNELPPKDHRSIPTTAVDSDLKSQRGQTSDWDALTDRQRNCMRALRELRAFDADSRKSARDIAKKAEGRDANVNGFKQPLSDLVARRLLQSKTGREGGYWLADTGRELLASQDQDPLTNDPSSRFAGLLRTGL